jgi:ribosomal protein L31E
MAEKTSETKGIERIYTIPLRKGFLKEPRSKRSNRARREVEIFLKRHTKANKIKLSKGLNELIFSRGFKKPPGKVKVEVKGNFETVHAKLPGELTETKREKKKGVAGLKERFMKTEEEKKKEEMKRKAEEKIKEATSEEKIKEAVEKVKKQEAEEKKPGKKEKKKKEFKEEKKSK